MSKSRQRRPLPHPIPDKTIGKCIYCGGTEDLRTEHVVPLGLNGVLQLHEATCRMCADETSALELRLLREMLQPARDMLNMRTRRKKNRRLRNTVPMIMERDGKEIIQGVPIEHGIVVIPTPVFGYPDYFAEKYRSQGIQVPTGFITTGVKAIQKVHAKSPNELAEHYETSRLAVDLEFSWRDYARLIAKIGHGYIVAQFGLESIQDSYVTDSILGHSKNVLRWVGCDNMRRLPKRENVGAIFHGIGLDVFDGDFLAWVQLFANFNTPEYVVVVGRATETLRGLLIATGRTNA